MPRQRRHKPPDYRPTASATASQLIVYAALLWITRADGQSDLTGPVRDRIEGLLHLEHSERQYASDVFGKLRNIPVHMSQTLTMDFLRKALKGMMSSALLRRVKEIAHQHERRMLGDASGITCAGCEGPVAGGLTCLCGKSWHSACALASLEPTMARLVPPAHLIPDAAAINDFTCLRCVDGTTRALPCGWADETATAIAAMSIDSLHDTIDNLSSASVKRRLPGSTTNKPRPNTTRYLFTALISFLIPKIFEG
jgi:hypothetical protein